MPDIFANTNDGFQASGLLAGWDNAHDTAGAGSPSTTQTTYNFAVGTIFSAPRSAYFIRRAFFEFDTSGISVAPSSATFQIFVPSTSYDNSSLIVVKSGHDPSDATEDWFSTWLTGLGGTLSGWSNSDSQVQPYTNNVTMAGSAGTTTFPFNSQGVTDVNSLAGTSTAFKIVLMNYDFDYLDVDPQPSGGSQITGLNFADHGTVAKRPFLEITVGTAGYGHKVINVPASDISKVIGVATADIDKVIGVD